MTTIQRLCGLSVLFIILLLSSCSESEKLAVPEKFAFPNECIDCHGSETKYPARGTRTQYLTSGHKILGNAFYSNAADCQRCHTNEGFVEFVKKGKIDTQQFVSNPSEIGCFTCHAPHDTGDFSLRRTSEVLLTNGVVFEKDNGNLCASCHQARRAANKEVRERNIPSGTWGAHHGPQADMLLGTNAYEFACARRLGRSVLCAGFWFFFPRRKNSCSLSRRYWGLGPEGHRVNASCKDNSP